MRYLRSVTLGAFLAIVVVGASASQQPPSATPQSAMLDLATGKSQALSTNELGMRAPRWSPDGRRITAQSRSDSTWRVSILNSDGSGLRSYAVPSSIINVQSMWSPSAKRVAVRTALELWIVNAETGASHRLGPVVHPHHLAWRSDGALVVARIYNIGTSQPWTWRLVESDTAGNERMLRDLSAEYPTYDPSSLAGYFISYDKYVLLNPRRVIVNPYGGEIELPGSGPRSGAPGHTSDGAFLVFGVGPDSAPIRSLELIDVAKQTSTIIALPFLGRTTAFSRPALLPDHSAAIILGRADTASAWAFYEVTFATGASRRITLIPGDPQAYHFDLSPDGKRLLYAYDVSTRRSNAPR
jgi:hypothetical protein